MVGNNTLVLNQATLLAALDMYLNSQRAPDAPRLKSTAVAQKQTHPCMLFEVEVSSEVTDA